MLDRNHWLWLLIGALLLLILLAAPVGGRKDGSGTWGLEEQTFSGTIEAVNQRTCEICHVTAVSVTLKVGHERLEVKLAPKGFLEDHDFSVRIGDSIEVCGNRYTERGKEVVLAGEIRKSGESLLLRGKYGRPAWTEARGHTCPVCGN